MAAVGTLRKRFGTDSNRPEKDKEAAALNLSVDAADASAHWTRLLDTLINDPISSRDAEVPLDRFKGRSIITQSSARDAEAPLDRFKGR